MYDKNMFFLILCGNCDVRYLVYCHFSPDVTNRDGLPRKFLINSSQSRPIDAFLTSSEKYIETNVS